MKCYLGLLILVIGLETCRAPSHDIKQGEAEVSGWLWQCRRVNG